MRWAGHGRSLYENLVAKVEGIAYLEDVGVDGCIKMDFKETEGGVMGTEMWYNLCAVLNRALP